MGSASLINQNRIYLINNGKIVTGLNYAFYILRHVVPKIIKAKLRIDSIDNIRFVRLFSGNWSQASESEIRSVSIHMLRIKKRRTKRILSMESIRSLAL